MGERAKKKREAESRAARKAKKDAEQVSSSSQLEERPDFTDLDSTTSDIKLPAKSNVKNPKKNSAAPHVPSFAPTSTRHSTRSLSSSSKLGSGKKQTSAKVQDDKTTATRPQRSATVAANSLLQQLQTEVTDFEEDPDGESNASDEADMVLISKN